MLVCPTFWLVLPTRLLRSVNVLYACQYIIFTFTEPFLLLFFWNYLWMLLMISNYECMFVANVKLIRYQFWCTRCAFRLMKSRQWYSGRKSWKSQKQTVKTVKEPKKKQYCAMKLIQIRRRIELYLREIILRFEMNLWNSRFSYSFIYIRIFKQVSNYLATGL
jgi:hypothetical protein